MDFQDLNLKFSESGAPIDFATASAKISNNYARAIAISANNNNIGVGVDDGQYVDVIQQTGLQHQPAPNGVGAVKRTTGDEAR